MAKGASAVMILDEQGAAFEAEGQQIDTGGMLVHATGDLSGAVPSDSHLSGPRVPSNATRLVRTVEMYQWKEEKQSETRKELGGGSETVTRYTYSQEWSDQPIASGGFEDQAGHYNPPLPIQGETFAVDRRLEVGERMLTIPARYVSRIGSEQSLPITGDEVSAIADALGSALPVTNSAGTAYFGYNPELPEIGDFRISYTVATADTASVVAADGGDGFAPWFSSNGREIFLVRDGAIAAPAMFAQEQKSNAAFTGYCAWSGLVPCWPASF